MDYRDMTPAWVPLLVAMIGVVGTLAGGLGGVLITQRRSDARDEKTWARERQREKERWLREDEARTFEERRAAYTEFYEAVVAMAHVARPTIRNEEGRDLVPTDFNKVAFGGLQKLRIYSSPAVEKAAISAYGTAYQLGTERDIQLGDMEAWEDVIADAEKALLTEIRHDLGVPQRAESIEIDRRTSRWPKRSDYGLPDDYVLPE
jgi:hypothetical protein